MATDGNDLESLAGMVRTALQSPDLDSFRDLLAVDVHWGPPDDDSASCHTRADMLAWWRRAAAAGVRATVTEVVPGKDALLVGLAVTGRDAAGKAGDPDMRWQVLTVRDGLVVDVRGYEERATAAMRAGVTGG